MSAFLLTLADKEHTKSSKPHPERRAQLNIFVPIKLKKISGSFACEQRT